MKINYRNLTGAELLLLGYMHKLATWIPDDRKQTLGTIYVGPDHELQLDFVSNLSIITPEGIPIVSPECREAIIEALEKGGE